MRTDRTKSNTYMKERREKLKAKGICVDCQTDPVKPRQPGEKPHTCCAFCLQERRDRWRFGKQRPLPLWPNWKEMVGDQIVERTIS